MYLCQLEQLARVKHDQDLAYAERRRLAHTAGRAPGPVRPARSVNDHRGRSLLRRLAMLASRRLVAQYAPACQPSPAGSHRGGLSSLRPRSAPATLYR